MKRSKNHRSKGKTLPSHQPFEDSLVLIILTKCEKIIHDVNRCIVSFYFSKF